MGITIMQKADSWQISIREEWFIDTYEEFFELSSFLAKNSIPFKVKYSFELIHACFEDSKVEYTDFAKFKKVLDTLLDYKVKFGHQIKEISRIAQNKI